MKKAKRTILYTLCLCTALLGFSCTKEMETEEHPAMPDVPCRVEFRIETEAATRATDHAVRNLNFYVYGNSGLVRSGYTISAFVPTMTLVPGTYRVYVVANAGSSLGQMDESELLVLSTPVTEQDGFLQNGAMYLSGMQTMTVAGSTTCLPIAEIAAEGFKEETGIDVLVSGLGSSAGIEAVSAGTADIASSSRGLNADEQDLGLTPIVIAHDGIAVIVNDDNPVDNLSTEQLRDIYAGKITNWKEVGGEDLRIQVINRDEASGTREAFRTIVMDGTPFDCRSAVLSGTGQVRDVVSRSRGAIGYISLGFVDSLNAKTSVKAVSVNHVEASEKTVASGGYPISRDLYFFVKGAPSQQAQDYIDYVTSEKMDKQIREAGFIPVTNDEKGSE